MIMLNILSIAVLATTVMTAFSYALSYMMRINFREPALLATLLKRLPLHAGIAGWIVHYAVGLLFVGAYFLLWEGLIPADFIMGILIGIANGILAIIVWHVTLTIHPKPPVVKRIYFYAQLVPAHLLFALVATACYQYVVQ